MGPVFLIILLGVVAYKVSRRLYRGHVYRVQLRDEEQRRRLARQRIIELDAALQRARPAPSMTPDAVPAQPWDHIPRIAFDHDTQMEFGGSRYHTHYISPEKAQDITDNWGADFEPGVYITDTKTGPERIGASPQKRWFIPDENVIKV